MGGVLDADPQIFVCRSNEWIELTDDVVWRGTELHFAPEAPISAVRRRMNTKRFGGYDAIIESTVKLFRNMTTRWAQTRERQKDPLYTLVYRQ